MVNGYWLWVIEVFAGEKQNLEPKTADTNSQAAGAFLSPWRRS